MMLFLAMMLASTVRAEPVQAPPGLASAGRPSASSGRTEKGQAPALEPQTAIEAERAFAADAQTLGQWTAFRKWAAPEAIMFWPQTENVHAKIKGWPDPARAVRWWPTNAWLSCDGTTAVTTGGSLWPDGRHGYFTTIWVRQPNGGWRWILDHGDFLTAPRSQPDQPATVTAPCKPKQMTDSMVGDYGDYIEASDGSMDDTVRYRRRVMRDGARRITVSVWNGGAFDVVIDDQVPAPAP